MYIWFAYNIVFFCKKNNKNGRNLYLQNQIKMIVYTQ